MPGLRLPNVRPGLGGSGWTNCGGSVPPKVARDILLPDELTDALDADPEMADAFAGLTPGRQRSYVIALRSAKKPETRIARIARLRDRILTGKGATEL